jgi:hypothetical protein
MASTNTPNEHHMKIIVTRGAYGFGHEWTLVAYGHEFYLGQDVKFCSRVLGMSPIEVVGQIGSPNIENAITNKRLAKLICEHLVVTRSNVKNLEPWSLCAS